MVKKLLSTARPASLTRSVKPILFWKDVLEGFDGKMMFNVV